MSFNLGIESKDSAHWTYANMLHTNDLATVNVCSCALSKVIAKLSLKGNCKEIRLNRDERSVGIIRIRVIVKMVSRITFHTSRVTRIFGPPYNQAASKFHI